MGRWASASRFGRVRLLRRGLSGGEAEREEGGDREGREQPGVSAHRGGPAFGRVSGKVAEKAIQDGKLQIQIDGKRNNI